MIDGDSSTYGIVYFDANVRWGSIELQLPGFDRVKFHRIEIHAGFDLQDMKVYVAGKFCGICSQGRECSLKCLSHVPPFKGKLGVSLEKYITTSQYETQWIIYEVKVSAIREIKLLLSSGQITGIASGAVIALLFIIWVVIYRRHEKREQYEDGFHRALKEGYASANARGERSGQFLIPHGHPSKYEEYSINRHRESEWYYDHDKVIFSISSLDGGYAYKNGFKHSCLVTFRIAGDAENAENHTDNARQNADNTTRNANNEEIAENTESADNAVEPTAPPSNSEIMNLLPPTYPASNAGRSHNFDKVPTYEEVMANSEYFPGAKE